MNLISLGFKLFLFFFSFKGICQTLICELPKKVNETSGLIILEDGTFLTLNDGGNKAEIYHLNKKGEILNTCEIEDEKNTDWEDLCIDNNGYIYIADIGNNKNDRKKLKILKIKLEKVISKKKTKAKSISFKYPNQKQFPPKDEHLYFDAEAITYYNDKLWIFTKNRTVPFNGVSFCYSIDLKEEKIKQETNLFFPKTNWMEESITSATIYDNTIYILTYTKIYIYTIVNSKLKWIETRFLSSLNQWEAISVTKKGIFLTHETNPISQAGLYVVEDEK